MRCANVHPLAHRCKRHVCSTLPCLTSYHRPGQSAFHLLTAACPARADGGTFLAVRVRPPPPCSAAPLLSAAAASVVDNQSITPTRPQMCPHFIHNPACAQLLSSIHNPTTGLGSFLPPLPHLPTPHHQPNYTVPLHGCSAPPTRNPPISLYPQVVHRLSTT